MKKTYFESFDYIITANCELKKCIVVKFVLSCEEYSGKKPGK